MGEAVRLRPPPKNVSLRRRAGDPVPDWEDGEQAFAVATGLIAYGLWLAHADDEYRTTILWLGGGSGLAGFAAGCIAGTSRRRYLWALAAGAVLVAGWLAVLLGWAYAENTLTWNSCSRDCAGPDPDVVLVFVYLANLVGWTIGATLGLGVRHDSGVREGG